MRIRSIKPEFWRSADISSLEWESRLLFIGLWSYVDDNGVGVDKLSSIAADLFADDLERDSSETFARVSRGLQNLSEASRIIRYTVEGKQFLEVVNWGKHQRIDKPNKARYPRHDAEFAVIRDTLATPSRESSDRNRGTGEQRNRGTGEEKTCPIPSDDFPSWWDVYPRKDSKIAAEKAYPKAWKLAGPQALLEGATRYRDDPNRKPAFTKLPATWLNAGSWNDGPIPDPDTSAPRMDHSARARAKEADMLARWQQSQTNDFLEIEG